MKNIQVTTTESGLSIEDLWNDYMRLSEMWKSHPYGTLEQNKAFMESEAAHERWRLAFLDLGNNAT